MTNEVINKLIISGKTFRLSNTTGTLYRFKGDTLQALAASRADKDNWQTSIRFSFEEMKERLMQLDKVYE
jgi:hypothetical protein